MFSSVSNVSIASCKAAKKAKYFESAKQNVKNRHIFT